MIAHQFEDMINKRSSGVLLHITSLPSTYGIGSLGEAAYRFVDFLVEAKQQYWQILPLGTTGFANSPYNNFSVYAGNLYLIDLDLLVEDGLLEPGAPYHADYGTDPSCVEYSAIYSHRALMFKWAYGAYVYKRLPEWQAAVDQFCKENEWIEDYAIFMAIKHSQKGLPWWDWPENLRSRKASGVEEFCKNNKDAIDYQIFLQYIFFKQWFKLKDYAQERGVKIIGDMPFYVAEDSVELWSQPELFETMETEQRICPSFVAGTPPDYFTDRGQLWGNPLYNWDYMAKDDYEWWYKRLKFQLKLYDYVRLDHFRAFDAYWAIPYGAASANEGEWRQGPKDKLFKRLLAEHRSLPLIAEDLSAVTDDVTELRQRLGLSGMAVLQYAFNPNMTSPYLPHNIEADNVCYVGTHDNDTVLGWCHRTMPIDLELARLYLGLNDREGYNWGMMRGAMISGANTTILTMQDLLNLDSSSRMNTPGTIGANWQWRMREGDLTPQLIDKLKTLTLVSGRLPQGG